MGLNKGVIEMADNENYLDESFASALEIASSYYPIITATFLLERYRKHADELIKCGALKESDYLQDLFVYTGGRITSREIKLIDNVNCYFTKTGVRREVCNSELLVYKNNFDWTLKTILYGLGIDIQHRYNCILNQFIWSFGTVYLKKYKIPLIIARCINLDEIYRVLAQYLNKHHVKTPALVLSIGSRLREYYALPGNNVCLAMQDVLINDMGKLYYNIDLMLEKMDKDVKAEGFSDGFRSAHIKSEFYTFSKKQAEAIELMDKSGKPMHQDEIMSIITPNSNYNRLASIFRVKDGIHKAWGTLIKTDGKGYYWLDY
jgi:hypothetical protein